MIGICENCCERLGKGLKQHHMIPRNMGGEFSIDNRITLCSPCELFLHISYTNEQLAKELNTREKILSNKEFRKFGEFIKRTNPKHKKISELKKLYKEVL